MLYDITLAIDYAYDQPSGMGHNLLRLTPADLPGRQRLIACGLTVAPQPTERSDRRDFFGNATVEVSFTAAHDHETFLVQARVDRTATAPGIDLSPPLDRIGAEIAARQSLAPEAPHHFLGASPRVRPMPETTAFARDLTHQGQTAFEAVLAIGRALHRELRFDAGATTVDTDPAEAFARRHGVCQDFSQIMIACLRGIGVPAGYVSGFLRTEPPPGKERLAGADAMHAWVRAWCGANAGWIEFDPTNDALVAADHIVVAVGRDYDDVAPVRGVLRTTGGQRSAQKVDVIPRG